MFRINVSVCVFLLLACCVLSMAAQSPAASTSEIVPPATTFYGCVNNSTGAIRIVQSFTSCKSTEHKIHWNQVGPRGPQGPQGPPGISVGYSAAIPLGVDTPITDAFPGDLMMQTNPVGTSGTYFISAGVLPFVASGDNDVFCYDTLTSLGAGNPSQWGGSFQNGNYAQVSISDALFISAGDSVQVYCESGGSNGSYVFNAAVTATLINSANKAKSAKSQHWHANPDQVSR